MFGSMKRALFAVSTVAVGGALIAAGSNAVAPAEVGQPAPDFTLTDYQGNEHTLSSYTDKGHVVVLEWYSPACPFVKKHYREDTQSMNKMITSWEGQPVTWLRVNSASISHPYGNREANLKSFEEFKITKPVLVDADGKVGKMYGAKRTPEMYVISKEGVLVYHGAFDNDRGARDAGDVNYVEKAVLETLSGQPVTTATTEAYGCGVKYQK
ncbi:MAG: redoxin domain-containing protein [Phycisphaerales bacterium]